MTEVTDMATIEAKNVEPIVTLEAQMRALLDALDKANREAATAKAEAEDAKTEAALAKERAEAEAERYLDKETRQRREAEAYTVMIRNTVTN